MSEPMKVEIFKYKCVSCDVEVFMDMPEADYCPNCGESLLEENYVELTNEDKLYLRRGLLGCTALK